jgi:glycosyltransferase involved in cell wall biosynthesis
MAAYGGVAALAYTWVRPKTNMLLTLQEGYPLECYPKRVGRFARLHRRIFERANALQAISTPLAKWGVSMGFAGEPELIPNGANLERFSQPISASCRAEIRRGWGVKDDDVVLITTSRLTPKNGIDDILRALPMLPPLVKAVIVGEGEDREKLQVLTKQKGLTDRVLFIGSKPHGELPALLKASDIFIRPSLSEGLGNSFLEAMAADIPIIGTSVGGIPDFLTDGETGVFCQPRHPESIRDAVNRLIGDVGLRERVVRQGHALVAERYEWNEISCRMRALLTRLAS